jgi:hypothetical protein
LEELQSQNGVRLTLTIVDGDVVPVAYPENYNEILIEKVQELLAFLSRNCIEKIIEEKVNFSEAFTEKSRDNTYLQNSIDDVMFSTNLQHTLISNDTYLLKHFAGLNPKLISPELFLFRHLNGKFQKEIAEYFIKNHYVGVTVNKDIILEEYLKKVAGKPNFFDTCLSNLRYKWSLSPVNMISGIMFLKEIYTSGFALDAERSLLAQTIFINLLDGCSGNERMVLLIQQIIFSQFKLLGTALDQINLAFKIAFSKYQ